MLCRTVNSFRHYLTSQCVTQRFISACCATFLTVAPVTSSGFGPQSHVQVDDPIGDANYINDMGRSGLNGTPFFGNVVTPTDLDDGADLFEVWFSNDSSTITLNIRTESPIGYEDPTRLFYVRATPERSPPYPRDCLLWVAVVGSEGAHLNTNYARVADDCNRSDHAGFPVELSIGELQDGTGIVTISTPRSYSPLFATGEKIGAPWAMSRIGHGTTTPIDTTARGDDYTIRR